MVESRFKVNIDKIKVLVDSCKEPQQIKPEEMTVDPASCLTKPLKPHFVCAICTGVVWDPKQCEECDCLLCNECIDKWLKQ